MKLIGLFLILLIAATVGLVACGEDDSPTSSSPPPASSTSESGDFSGKAQEICNEGRCLGDAGLRNQCMQTYDDCAAENQARDDECVAKALLMCQL